MNQKRATTDDAKLRRAFSARMREAGWERNPGPGFGWIHPATGTQWEGENYVAGEGIAWEQYAHGGTPPTEVRQI